MYKIGGGVFLGAAAQVHVAIMYIKALCVDRESCYLSSCMILSCYVILFSCCHDVMLKGLVIFSRLGYTK